MSKLSELRKRAKALSVKIECERDDVGWGYWLVGTGWKDGNFCADLDEVASALADIEKERKA